MPVNWCEALGTVLSNDEVIDGKSERGGYPVVKKMMMQWVIDQPAFAEKLLEGLDEIVVGTIKLGELLKDETMTFPIQIPDGVTNETGVSEATVEIKFPDLTTRTFTVTDIRAINVPAGLKVEMITQALEVQIRGPKVLMKNMTEADIIITVDFENEPVGTATKKATITMSGDFLEAGAVGVYQVLAKVKPAGG